MMTTRMHQYFFRARLMSILLVLSGCAALTGTQERFVACPYDTVWEEALDTMKSYPISTTDEQAGRIETSWVEGDAAGRPYGLFGRQGLQEKERFRSTLIVEKKKDDVVVLRLTERREHWGFRGGARIYQWYPVPASEETIDAVLIPLAAKLKQHGCLVTT